MVPVPVPVTVVQYRLNAKFYNRKGRQAKVLKKVLSLSYYDGRINVSDSCNFVTR